MVAVRSVPKSTAGNASPISPVLAPRDKVEPEPIAPTAPYPQHFTLMLSSNAHEWEAPVAIARAERPDPSEIANELATEAPIPSPMFDVDSLPSWPSLPNPKHLTELSTSTTHVWVSPAERYPMRSRVLDVDPPPTSA